MNGNCPNDIIDLLCIITTIGGIRCFLEKRKLLIDNIKLEKSRATSDDNKLEQLKSCQQLSRSLTGLPPIYKEKEEISKENFEKVELSCSDSQPSNSFAECNFDVLSQKIRALFPNEQQAFYYVPPKSEGPSQKVSKGKLPDFYRNKLDVCRQIGLIKMKKTDENIDDSNIELHINPETKHACKTHMQWLRYNTTPWSAVKEHWDKSRELRQDFIKQHTGNVYDIFKEYPVLKQEFGYVLVRIIKNSFFSILYFIVFYISAG
ncbi:uncharacterized protein LOC116853121 [Odontomachus brunneus]|uniref:uncharacterized protein LOC116853121 n=1 Tax=Odontomachus brunneus TaxID=486640 RepID=UPI0013F1F975|nr:uncharacterized protein LOC116853121 [Odontomachus brunneus]